MINNLKTNKFMNLEEQNKKLKSLLKSVSLSMSAHPDYEEGSEFYDYVEAIKDALNEQSQHPSYDLKMQSNFGDENL